VRSVAVCLLLPAAALAPTTNRLLHRTFRPEKGRTVAGEDNTSAPRVLVVALGGTIAMTATEDGGVTPSLTARQLVDAVPGLADGGVDIEVLTLRSKPGASLTLTDLVEPDR
jgi:L-asparaginase/Glu-tRNA(Gln) amidotransferase subunit D